ncbi:MAG: hypothetical protein V5A20_09445 [Salinibacter sp.]|uniref:hypothetical protein n=1 Tax=Salinibacter sp. TaxID=2065818 RepID=UPI002FC37B7C
MGERDDIRNGDLPLRNPSVEAYRVGDGAVLHDVGRDRVVAVTPLARAVWERCDGNTSFEELTRAINALDDAPLPKTTGRLQQIIAHLSDHELLVVHGSAPGGDRSPADEGTTLHVVFGRHQVRVQARAPECARAAQRRFYGMLGDGRGLETIGGLTVGGADGQYSVWGPERSHVEERPLEPAIRGLKHAVLRRFMEARRDLIWLHAGAAARDDDAVLVAGPSGSGKSTVIADLCRSGWQYLSDDITPYAPDSDKIMPFPATMAYREPEGERGSGDELADLPKKHMRLDAERLQDAPVQPTALFFPTFETGRPAEVKELPAPEAAVSLVESCQNASRHRGEAVRRLCHLAGRVPAFQLRYNERSRILGLLTSALG